EVSSLQKEFDATHPELAESFANWEKAQMALLAAFDKTNAPPSDRAKPEDEANMDNREKSAELAKDKKPPAKEIAGLLKVPAGERDEKQREKLYGYFKEQSPELADLRKHLAAAKKARADFEATV